MPDNDSSAERALDDWSGNLEQTLPIGPVTRVGAYELIEEVGRGGMGVVYKARQAGSDAVVAVKLLSGHSIDNPKFRQRFLREARAAAAMTHPNIARVHGVFEDGRLLYIVMDYVPGGTLRHRINQQRGRDLHWVVSIAKQVARGLASAHEAGVIHRDIKPSNILLDLTGEHAWIADFGLAVFELSDDSLTSTGNPLGTPAYMSPEQARGERLDKRSDLFSLGSLIYAMVTGHSPFQATNLMAVMRQIVEFHPPSLNAGELHVPSAFSMVVDRLLKKDPEERYACAEDVIAALERCEATLSGGSTICDADAPTSKVPPPSRWRRRAPAFGLAVVVGLAAIAWGISNHWSPTAALSEKKSLSPPLPLMAKTPRPPAVGTTVAPSSTTKPPEATRAVRRLTVATARTAEFRTLQAALREAGPHDVIEVLDEGTYQGPFIISDPYRLEGIQLTSASGATLTAESGDGRLAVLTIADTRRVRVNGFRIIGRPELHTVRLSGNLSGTMLDALKLEQPTEAEWANVLVDGECRGTVDEAVTIRGCRLQSGKYGIFFGRSQVPQSIEATHVLVDGNYFAGPGTHIVLFHSATEIRIEHNIFEQGLGIEFHLESLRQSGPFSVCNNTFFQTEGWITFGPDRQDYRGTAANNLIVAASARPSVDEWSTRAVPWNLHHNVWESPACSREEAIDGFGLSTRDAGLRSYDPASSLFLRPAPNGIAATRGAGAPLADYVGARKPDPFTTGDPP